ncbi:MAG: sphingomyelin synthase family protein [Bacteroidales bacterium]|jgi:membrane-associated phospholipid phosphatase|nr:sphingomyelin synthase family protein [Bacteroidales bacterium]
MNNTILQKPGTAFSLPGIFSSLVPLLKSRYTWIGLLSIIAGAGLNFASQAYLHNYMIEGKTLPMLSDMILDNVPVIDLSLVYDIFCLVVLAAVITYVIHRDQFNRVPYIMFLCGIFFIIRGIFIVLTPFGNPPEFNGSDPLFNGFSKYELGVYPSGHVGNSFLMLLLVYDKVYRYILWFCLAVIIITLIFSHGHYSIDILSGFFFAYAIKAFGDKYLTMFILPENKEVTD